MKTLWVAGVAALFFGCAVGTEPTDVAADTTSVRGQVVGDGLGADHVGTTSAASVDVGRLKGSPGGTVGKNIEPTPQPWAEPSPEPWAPTKPGDSKGSSGSGSSQKP
jgi:hypothetical protein